MKKAQAKKIILKYLRKFAKDMMDQCGLAELDYTIFQDGFHNPTHRKDVMTLSIDGNIYDAFSYNSYCPRLYALYGVKMETELAEKGFFAEPYDGCHLDIYPED